MTQMLGIIIINDINLENKKHPPPQLVIALLNRQVRVWFDNQKNSNIMSNNNKVQSFSELYEHTVSGESLLSDFIKGHLVIEFLMIKIIEKSNPQLLLFAEGLNHYKLIQLIHGLNLITDDQQEVLMLINKMRNKFAHQLTFEPPLNDLKIIFEKAAIAFSDMTDGLEQGLGEIKGKSTIKECEDWVIPEMFVQISYDLHDIYQDLGGDIEMF